MSIVEWQVAGFGAAIIAALFFVGRAVGREKPRDRRR